MKKLLIIFIAALVGCSESEPTKSYSDLSGTWSFEGGIFSGSLKIAKTLDGEYSIEPPTTFYINGKSYTSPSSRKIYVNGLYVAFELYGSNDGFLWLRDVLYKPGFTEMTSTAQTYAENCLTDQNCPSVSSEASIKFRRR